MIRIALFFSLVVLSQSFCPIRTHDGRIHNSRRASSSSSSLSGASKQYDVAVFGGGFGGLYTALEIRRKAANKKLSIALVDPKDSFVFSPLLYDLVAGTATQAEVCPRYADLLQGTGIQHICASLDTISAQGQATLIPSTEKHNNNPTNTNNNNNSYSYITTASRTLSFRAGVVAVGATPQRDMVPGASEYALPFYTARDAMALRQTLQQENPQRLAIVGGGYGGVELAACLQKRLPRAKVTLVSRRTPLEGTRAEAWVTQTLQELGVAVETAVVERLERDEDGGLVVLTRTSVDTQETRVDAWDAVLWTGGSQAAVPPNGWEGLQITSLRRLAVDKTLRCLANPSSSSQQQQQQQQQQQLQQPCLWALGDCVDIVSEISGSRTPKTAQAAMQQANVVSNNVVAHLLGTNRVQEFNYQDLGSLMTLGGVSGAILAPRQGPWASLLVPLLNATNQVLNVADQVLSITPISLLPRGSIPGLSEGTLAGTISGAARRALYAGRMPTDRQRAVSLVSATLLSAAEWAREARSSSEMKR